MQLKDYIPKIDNKYKKVSFSGISFDSSKVKKGNIFFAIKGSKFDGNNFIDQAIKKGARIIVSEKKNKKKNKKYNFFVIQMWENCCQIFHIKFKK